jgi:hypothetical protein
VKNGDIEADCGHRKKHNGTVLFCPNCLTAWRPAKISRRIEAKYWKLIK